MTIDLGPAASEVTRLLDNLLDDDLRRPTPCPEYTVGGMLDHFMGLTLAFTGGAEKSGQASPPPAPGAQDPDPDWRTLLPQRLDDLAAAWREPGAWDGETTVGGVTLPAQQHGLFALDELVMHGWDLARATGQQFRVDDATLAAVLGLLEQSAELPQEQRAGLFGPVVEIPSGASDLDQAVAYAGRRPDWTPDA